MVWQDILINRVICRAELILALNNIFPDSSFKLIENIEEIADNQLDIVCQAFINNSDFPIMLSLGMRSIFPKTIKLC